MQARGFIEAQIIAVLKEAESRPTSKDICRCHGTSEQTLYRWKAKFGGVQLSDARRLKELEQENARLKRLITGLTQDRKPLKELLEKTDKARSYTRHTRSLHAARSRRARGRFGGYGLLASGSDRSGVCCHDLPLRRSPRQESPRVRRAAYRTLAAWSCLGPHTCVWPDVYCQRRHRRIR